MAKQVLFNPGPTNVPEDVRQALSAAPDMNHREPEFAALLRDVLADLVELAGGGREFSCVPFVSSGTGANEAMLGACQGKVLVLIAGRYGQRLADIAARLDIPCLELHFKPLKGVDANAVESMLQKNPDITYVAFAHHETTTSILAPLQQLGDLCRRYGKVMIVDAVSSLYGHDVHIGRDNVDFCTVTTNKCLESVPGMSFVIARNDRLRELEGKSRSYYFNLFEQWRRTHYDGVPPFTMPLYQLLAARVALRRLRQEGVPNRAQRYRQLKQRLRAGLRELGLNSPALSDDETANILQLIERPPYVDYRALHAYLKPRGQTIYTDELTLQAGYLYFATLGDLGAHHVDALVQNVGAYLADHRVRRVLTRGLTDS